MIEREEPNTRAWVLHPEVKNDQDRRLAEPALEEAVSLAGAMPFIDVLGAEVVRLPKVHAGQMFGSGKVEELHNRFKDNEVELVLIDGHVSPIQQRNLEKAWGVKILDRTGLILEIFSDRARTREGVLQVEMAALSYQRSRLVRAWTHLERQRGGFGFVGGPGETQKEADRRAIDDQLVKLRRQLDKVVRTREVNRAARAAVPFPIVALVGYTNAGKSTLFNLMTGAEVLAKDMLFATLDPTMRRIKLPTGQEVILSDTVGFISALPTELVAAFRATLEEVLEADVIVHVRDISHPQTTEQAKDVETILESLGVREDVERLEIWNKVDRLPEDEAEALRVQAARTEGVLATSAVTGEGVEALLAAIGDLAGDRRHEEVIDVSFANGRGRAWLFAKGIVRSEEQTESGYRMTVYWTKRQADEYLRM